MTIADKIKAIESRINLLKERGETMNHRIIRKCERKVRALKAQQYWKMGLLSQAFFLGFSC